MTEQEWTPDRFYTYKFTKNDNSQSVTLVIPFESAWSEDDLWDIAMYDLATHLGVDEEDAKDNWWDEDSWLSTAEDMETMGGVYSAHRNKEN